MKMDFYDRGTSCQESLDKAGRTKLNVHQPRDCSKNRAVFRP